MISRRAMLRLGAAGVLASQLGALESIWSARRALSAAPPTLVKTILMEQGSAGPGLSAADLVLAWATPNHALALAASADAGHTFRRLSALAATTPHAPAVVQVAGGTLLAWTGMDRRLNLAGSADGGHAFGTRAQLGDRSIAGPALAVLAGTLAGTPTASPSPGTVVAPSTSLPTISPSAAQGSRPAPISAAPGPVLLAWTGIDADYHLNLMTSTDGGHSFGNKMTLAERSIRAPALAASGVGLGVGGGGADPTPGHAHGEDDDRGRAKPLAYTYPTPGLMDATPTPSASPSPASSPSPSPSPSPSTSPTASPSPSPSAGAAIGGGDNRAMVLLAWVGADPGHHLNVMSSTDGGATFTNKVTLAFASDHAPGLAFARGLWWLAWRDATSHLNLAASADGMTFGSPVALNELSPFAPNLASDGANRLYLAWTGTDPERRLNVASVAGG